MRIAPAIVACLGLALAGACERSSGGNGADKPREPVEVFVVTAVEPLIREALDAYAPGRKEFDFFIRPGSSQSLARQIAAGVRADLVISGAPDSLGGADPAPRSVRPWIVNRLVVVTASSSTLTMREFDFGQTRIAIATDSTDLGLHTRLAMRQRETWTESQGRIDWVSSPGEAVQRVQSGASPFAVMHATDARRADLRVVEELDLPESVELDYVLAPYSDEGERFGAWLTGPEGAALAQRLGYEPAEAP